MKIVAACSLVLGFGSWMGWNVFGALLAVCIGVVLVIVLPIAGYMLLVLHWMQDGEQVS